MAQMKVLGAYGGKFSSKHTTTFRIGDDLVIDAGNLVEGLGEDAPKLRHVFLTHSHLDHIVDIPFIIDAVFDRIGTSLRVYGLQATIEALQQHLMNDRLWPDFSKIMLPGGKEPAIVFEHIELNQSYRIGEYEITPIDADHVVAACGYVVSHASGALLISGDTYMNRDIIRQIDRSPEIHSVVLEVSFPSHMEAIARESKHLTPKLVVELLEAFPRTDLKIYFYHMKPDYKEEIATELAAMLGDRFEWCLLDDGDTVPFA